MANITTIDPGQAGWDRVANKNFETLANTVVGGRNYFSMANFNANKFEESVLKMPSVILQLKPNTVYTVSTTIPARTDLDDAQDCFAGPVGFRPESGVNGVKDTAPLTVTTDAVGKLQVSYRNTNLRENHIQVELGDKATDWRPAIEDMAQVSDTGWQTEGVGLVNGAKVTDSKPNNVPMYRFVTLTANGEELHLLSIHAGLTGFSSRSKIITLPTSVQSALENVQGIPFGDDSYHATLWLSASGPNVYFDTYQGTAQSAPSGGVLISTTVMY
ncbi:hypothetical protein [Lactiplantibacillus plajomi]|uniref:Extracellular protein n=1 Tax=Lactiplantibacillus plajomi TaxID=1457217 RepID=A0ABV6K215_9LACO|nr:hypothetical protein [Lactiplantibacillus plajomi]